SAAIAGRVRVGLAKVLMPSPQPLEPVRRHDRTDGRELAAIVSPGVSEATIGEPELGVAAATFHVDVRGLSAIASAKAECVAGFSMERGHAGMLISGSY